MSDIKVGDLVVVVRDGDCVCSAHPSDLLGQIFTVTELGFNGGFCSQCLRPIIHRLGAKGYRSMMGGWLGLNRLRRIPPFLELEETERKEEFPTCPIETT